MLLEQNAALRQNLNAVQARAARYAELDDTREQRDAPLRAWLESLPKRQFGHVLAFAEKLAGEASTLGEPYSRHLGGKVRELRIPLHPSMCG